VNALDLRRELAELDEMIAAADERLARHRGDLDRLREAGAETAAAKTAVASTWRALATMRRRRRLILEKVNVPL
jgi:hypothetical protein